MTTPFDYEHEHRCAEHEHEHEHELGDRRLVFQNPQGQNVARHRAGKVDCPFVKPRKPGSA